MTISHIQPITAANQRRSRFLSMTIGLMVALLAVAPIGIGAGLVSTMSAPAAHAQPVFNSGPLPEPGDPGSVGGDHTHGTDITMIPPPDDWSARVSGTPVSHGARDGGKGKG